MSIGSENPVRTVSSIPPIVPPSISVVRPDMVSHSTFDMLSSASLDQETIIAESVDLMGKQKDLIGELEIYVKSLRSKVADFQDGAVPLASDLKPTLSSTPSLDDTTVDTRTAYSESRTAWSERDEDTSLQACGRISSRASAYLSQQIQASELIELGEKCVLSNASRIGAGNKGSVLKLKDKKSGDELAVKMISLRRASLPTEAVNFERLKAEAEMMCDLDHPNIVKLLDVCFQSRPMPLVTTAPPYLCIIMEYVEEGEPLSNVLRREGGSQVLASKVLPQIAQGLLEMHRNGIVHRDVWSENVVMDKTGRCVLVDLGCAERYHLGPPQQQPKLNLPYMSPESCDNEVSPGDDAWSLGVLLSELITGRFIGNRMGRIDIPIHFKPDKLKEVITDTKKLGGIFFGNMCEKLLDLNGAQRLSMAGVLSQMSGNPTHSVGIHNQSHNSQTRLAVSPAPVVTRAKAVQATNLTHSLTLPGSLLTTRGGFSQGQKVMYTARSNGMDYKGIVIGRNATGTLQIRLDCGQIKDVEDSDMWRLKAIC